MCAVVMIGRRDGFTVPVEGSSLDETQQEDATLP